MKIVLLTLSGREEAVLEKLRDRFPKATVEHFSRAEFESGSTANSLATLRKRRPDIFAVATERLVWQRGQEAFLLLGALAGAGRTVIVDSHGGWREELSTRALFRAPVRLVREAAVSNVALRRAERELARLATAVSAMKSQRNGSYSRDNPSHSIVYLRSSPGPGTQAGGAAAHINGFLNAAVDLGVHVSLISNDEIAGLDEAKLPTKIIWAKPVGTARAAFDIYNNLLFTDAATEEIERHRPDFIYQRYARFSWAGVAATLRTKRPLFLEYNGSEVWVGRHWDRVDKLDLLARYEQLNLEAASRIFVVSEVERQNLIKSGIEPEKIIVNPNGVDVDTFRPGVGGENVRREFGVPPDVPLVGFVGTFGPWHGVEVLAQAIARIPAEILIRFLLVGNGALRGRFESMLREAGATDRVLLLGAVDHQRVPSLLDACDLFVSPHVPLDAGAEFFGSPTKLFEYMAMGKGIVASRLGQIGDVLEDEKTALLVEPGSVEQLTQSIIRLTADKELRQRLGNAARDVAVSRYTWKHNVRRVLDEYASL